jgi:hypothetical protein
MDKVVPVHSMKANGGSRGIAPLKDVKQRTLKQFPNKRGM